MLEIVPSLDNCITLHCRYIIDNLKDFNRFPLPESKYTINTLKRQ